MNRSEYLAVLSYSISSLPVYATRSTQKPCYPQRLLHDFGQSQKNISLSLGDLCVTKVRGKRATPSPWGEGRGEGIS